MHFPDSELHESDLEIALSDCITLKIFRLRQAKDKVDLVCMVQNAE